jgi:hypothetical protein
VFETCWGVSECKKVSCGLLVRASQTGASGPVRGGCSRRFAQDSAPDCTDLDKSTLEMHLPTSFVRLIASFAVNSRYVPCLAGVRMTR